MKTTSYITAFIFATCSAFAMADQSNEAETSTLATATATHGSVSAVDAKTLTKQVTVSFDTAYSVPDQTNKAGTVGIAAAASDKGSVAAVNVDTETVQKAFQAHVPAPLKVPTK